MKLKVLRKDGITGVVSREKRGTSMSTGEGGRTCKGDTEVKVAMKVFPWLWEDKVKVTNLTKIRFPD